MAEKIQPPPLAVTAVGGIPQDAVRSRQVREKQKTVLIVEDDEPILKILNEKLEREGMKTMLARDGEEGLKDAKKNHPDLIILDILMPKMDGIAMLKKLRQDPWGKRAEVIILTNLSHEVKETEALEQGVTDYWVKSDWRLADVAAQVKKKLGMAQER
jgi:two-component system alkaline phosphatase synthesis response regulator PhoP